MPKMTKTEITQLTETLKTAREAAAKAIEGRPDGGTCCLDWPAIRVPRTKAVFEAIRAAGFDPSKGWGLFKGYVRLGNFPGCHFQGWNRTTGAETVSETLRAAGLDTGVYYAMD